jgi:hypothetical protein
VFHTIPGIVSEVRVLGIGEAILYEDRGLGKEPIKEGRPDGIIIIAGFLMPRGIYVMMVDVLVIELDLPDLCEAIAHLCGSGIVVEKSLFACEFVRLDLGGMSKGVDRLDLEAARKIKVEAHICLLILPVLVVIVGVGVQVRSVARFQEMSFPRERDLKLNPRGDDGDPVFLYVLRVLGGKKDVAVIGLGDLHEGVDPDRAEVEVSHGKGWIGPRCAGNQDE